MSMMSLNEYKLGRLTICLEQTVDKYFFITYESRNLFCSLMSLQIKTDLKTDSAKAQRAFQFCKKWLKDGAIRKAVFKFYKDFGESGGFLNYVIENNLDNKTLDEIFLIYKLTKEDDK